MCDLPSQHADHRHLFRQGFCAWGYVMLKLSHFLPRVGCHAGETLLSGAPTPGLLSSALSSQFHSITERGGRARSVQPPMILDVSYGGAWGF